MNTDKYLNQIVPMRGIDPLTSEPLTAEGFNLENAQTHEENTKMAFDKLGRIGAAFLWASKP